MRLAHLALRLPAALLLGASLAALAAPAAAEGPKGGVVVRGKAAIAGGAARTTVTQSSRRAVIDWDGFDVGRGHVVDFVQPGRRAATLNRVGKGGPSVIRGAIRAPGTVIVQNRAGVVFAPEARIDVGGLVAASQDIDAGRFQARGRLVIGGGEAAGARVVNAGRVTVGEAGLAALVGGAVENDGVIVARRGVVALASGARSVIDLSGDGMIRIAVAGDAGGAAPGVRNSGTIDAAGGRVLLSAGAAARALDAAINTGGAIRAGSPTGDGGAVEIAARGRGRVRLDGAIDAAGGRDGGAVTVTGARIAIAPSARIDVSGGRDGGTARLGGDRGGVGPLRRARGLAMAAGASIDAGGGAGRGGEVALWSDGATRVDGAVRAGGAAGGGFIETSGARALAIGPAARVEPGAGGAWLLDPRDVVIGAAAGGVPGTPPATGVGPYVIDAGALAAALNLGADVTVATAQPAFSDAGNISVASAVTWSGAGDLTLAADGGIAVDANLQSLGTGDLVLRAGAGDIAVGGGGGPGRIVSTTAGALRLAAPQGDVTFRRSDNHPSSVQAYSASGPVEIEAGGAIRLLGGALGGRWVRVGRADAAAPVRLAAPLIEVVGGGAGNAFAELVAGPGGALELAAGLISVRNGTRDQGRIAASGGAPLTLLAARQVWDGPVRSGSGAGDGGDVVIAGAVSAGFQPQFSLAPAASFAFRAAAPGGAASSYVSTEPFAVEIRPAAAGPRATGRVEIDAPVSAARIEILSEAGVRLGPQGGLRAAGPGDAIVVAAGAGFDNAAHLGAGAFALDDPDGRWLLYLDAFAGLAGPAPAGRGVDLYGRSYAATPPHALVHGGSRLIYAERPTLTLTGDRLAKTYGETLAFAPGFAASGLRPGDSLADALVAAPVVASAGAGPGAHVGRHALTLAAAASDQGYRLRLVEGAVDVAPAPLTVTARDARRLYGAGEPAFAVDFAGFVNGEGPEALGGALFFATRARRASDVGRYAVTPSGLASADYRIAYVSGALDIDPAPLRLRARDQRRVYGAADFDPRDFAAAGLVLDHDASVVTGGLATAAGAAAGVGAYAIGQGTLAAANYAITFLPATLTVDPAPLAVAIADQRRAYGSASFDPRAFTASGFVLGEDASVILGALATHATAGSDVGAYAIKRGSLAAANYVISAPRGVLTIDPAPLAVAAASQRRVYGSAGFDPRAFTASGFVLGEDASVVTGGLATAAGAGSGVGAYAIGRGTLAAGNYAISYAPGTLTIDPAPLAVAAASQRRVYGAAGFDPRAFTASGFVLGEDASVVTGGLATAAGAGSGVGAYAIGRGTLAAGNYAISYAPGTLTIDPAPLAVAAASQRRVYGSAGFDPRAFTASGFVLGEDASVVTGGLATAAGAGSGVGAYAIGRGTLAAGNYAISYAPGTLTIDPAPLAVAAASQRRVYGSAGFDPRAFTASGFVLGEDASVVTGGLATAAGAGSGVGAYAIGRGTLAAGNYAISYAPGTLSIDRAPLAVAAASQRRVYGSAGFDPRAFTASGFVLGEDASVVTGGLATAAGAGSGVGAYAIGRGTLAAGNYAISYAPGTLSIDRAPLRVIAADAARSEGGRDPRFAVRFEGFVRGEGPGALDGVLAVASDAGPGAGPGRYRLTPGGLTAANYDIAFVAGTLTVEPAARPAPPARDIAPVAAGTTPPARGLPPLTPGDAAFRTTRLEAPTARDTPFRLTYSLGAFQGPAAPGTAGFVPASGGARQAAACDDGAGAPGCAATESFWTTLAEAAR